MVDEAHATGAIGPGGRGSVAAAGLSGEVDVVMGTLGKALGSYGAYVCASRETTDYLLNAARTFVFSTALPPSVAAAGLAALELLEAQPERVERLAANARTLRDALACEGLEVGGSETQIVPLPVGDAGTAMDLCERILERGVFAQGIRPPTVPEGSSRLRFTVMSTHRREELERAAKLVGSAARELGVGARSLRGRSASCLMAAAKGFFVTGTGTEVGKTVVAAALAHDLRRQGSTVAVFKPAVTGLDEPGEPDHALLRRAAGSAQSDDEIAPYRYGPPASPHLAAAQAGEEIDPERLRGAARDAAAAGRTPRLRGRRRPARSRSPPGLPSP